MGIIYRFAAEECACRKGRLYVYSRYSAVFGRKPKESTPRLAAALSGNGKTIWATDPRQRMIALSMNESDLRYAY